MRSFRSAIAVGCDLIECDVHLSSDGRLVVIHDHTLERTTNGSGLVRHYTAAELRKLDAGDGEKIPLLQEVIELALGKVGLVIELKQVPPLYPGLEDKLLNMLRQLGAVPECAVVSFNHQAIHQLRIVEPSLQLGILEGARPMHPAKMLREAGADVYSPPGRPQTAGTGNAWGGVTPPSGRRAGAPPAPRTSRPGCPGARARRSPASTRAARRQRPACVESLATPPVTAFALRCAASAV